MAEIKEKVLSCFRKPLESFKQVSDFLMFRRIKNVLSREYFLSIVSFEKARFFNKPGYYDDFVNLLACAMKYKKRVG